MKNDGYGQNVDPEAFNQNVDPGAFHRFLKQHQDMMNMNPFVPAMPPNIGLGGTLRGQAESTVPVQKFESGATRSDDSNKPDFEGFFSPLVMDAYAEYMQEHRVQDDGKVRASDNWQRGMPFHKYMKSLFRHFMQLWHLHRGWAVKPEKRAGKLVPVTVTSAISGILFNTMGYFHEYLRDIENWEDRIISEPEDGDVIRARPVQDHMRQRKAREE